MAFKSRTWPSSRSAYSKAPRLPHGGFHTFQALGKPFQHSFWTQVLNTIFGTHTFNESAAFKKVYYLTAFNEDVCFPIDVPECLNGFKRLKNVQAFFGSLKIYLRLLMASLFGVQEAVLKRSGLDAFWIRAPTLPREFSPAVGLVWFPEKRVPILPSSSPRLGPIAGLSSELSQKDRWRSVSLKKLSSVADTSRLRSSCGQTPICDNNLAKKSSYRQAHSAIRRISRIKF